MLKRDRLMGIGQAIMMPLFFASNALYPVTVMPAWLQGVSHVNPLSYEVSALRGLLLGTPTTLWLDFARARRHGGSRDRHRLRAAGPADPLTPGPGRSPRLG